MIKHHYEIFITYCNVFRMSTFQIIKLQLSHMLSKPNLFFVICTPAILLSIFADYLTIEGFILTPIILWIAYYVAYVLVAVNTHRLVILGEENNFYSFKNRSKLVFTYIIITLLITFFVYAPWGIVMLLPVMPFEGSSFGVILGFIFIIVGLVAMFIVYPSFALHLPLASIGKKIPFFKMWKLSKGFKLTIFLQFLIIMIIFAVPAVPIVLYIGVNLITNIFLSILSIYAFALTVSCLSRTFILWQEKTDHKE